MPAGQQRIAASAYATRLPPAATNAPEIPYQQQNYWLRGLIAMLLMLSVWVSFHPFASSTEANANGDIVNQLGFGSLLILCLATLTMLVDRRLLIRLIKPSYLAVGLVLVMSVAVSSGMASSFRAMVFSVIVVMAALTVVTLPRNVSQFAVFVASGCLVALAFSYFALAVYPLEAMHQPGGSEPQHAGLWRGVYDHKNVASAVVSVFALIGYFAWQQKHRLLGISVAALSLIFLLNSGSKTSLALLPVALIYPKIISSTKYPAARFILALLPLSILFTITVGSAVFPAINNVLQSIAPGTTFTGRLDLWQFTVDRIAEYPIFGRGFENFWGTPAVTNLDQPIELSWDVREIVHGHNSYLDTAISFGLTGLVVMMFALIVIPAADFAGTVWTGSTSRLAEMFMSIWLFTTLNACLESFFFRRADPVWFGMLIAILGLRLLATGQTGKKA